MIEGVDGQEGLKGDICVAFGRMEEAKMHYKLAVDAEPKDYVSMVNLGKIYADEDNMSEAEMWWTRALNVNRKDPVVWQNLSALEVVRGRHDAALEKLKEAEKYVKA
jgi:predicted Zn-dependent protease